MADIRINSLPTTASASSSDDFLALDGSANGTRKLNAFSPTFGGNLTAAGNLVLTATTPEINTGTGGLMIRRSDNSSVVTEVKTTALGGTSTLRLNSSAYGAFDVVATTSGGGAALQVLNGATQVAQFGGGTATATTLAGNLTVSGGAITGGSSGMSLAAGGINQSITLTPNGTGATIAASSGVDAVPALGAAGGRFRISTSGFGMLMGSDSSGAGWIQQQRVDGTATSYPLWLQPNGGNVLVGTTVDSGAKLQVGTNTTTSAGGMVFGTDTNLYRTGAGSIAINSTSLAELALVRGSTVEAKVYSDSTGSLKVQTSGTLALTLDSSQNATFEGRITLNNVGGDTKLTFKRTGGKDWTVQHDASQFYFYNLTDNKIGLLIPNAGSVVIGNTGANATTATDGYLYVPTCAGTPTGTPTAFTGKSAVVVDTTNNKLYFYSGGAWRDAGP